MIFDRFGIEGIFFNFYGFGIVVLGFNFNYNKVRIIGKLFDDFCFDNCIIF